ncbi:MAG: hypothetical protein NTX16_13385, partial [Actinobacteria bacterium]|nr:hypothetical protein [Actinomycetota bacterium]
EWGVVNDTPSDVDELYRRMLLRRSPVERLGMACRMFSSARVLGRAGMPATSAAQIRRQMLLRLYAADMPDDRLRERAIRAIGG